MAFKLKLLSYLYTMSTLKHLLYAKANDDWIDALEVTNLYFDSVVYFQEL